MNDDPIVLPRYIALCGKPGSGKSEVQKILEDQYGVVPIDDGYPARQYAMDWLGLTANQVYTAEGKRERVRILNREWEVREILGEVAKGYERLFGDWIMPFMALEKLKKQRPGGHYEEATSFSFGSVRRDQGMFYQRRGGVVLGVRRPGNSEPGYEFDQFDTRIVQYWIDNEGTGDNWREELKLEVRKAVDWMRHYQSLQRMVGSSGENQKVA